MITKIIVEVVLCLASQQFIMLILDSEWNYD